MKKKIINKVITSKFNSFLESIKDEKVKNLVKENSLITGGCIASMLLKEKVNDFDIYFTNKETVVAVCNYFMKMYIKKNPSSLAELIDIDSITDLKTREYYELRGFKEIGRVGIFFRNINELKNIQNDDLDEEDGVEKVDDQKEEENPKYTVAYISPNAISLTGKIQIITRFYGDHTEIHKNFDYLHCTNYWLSADESLYLNQPALENILDKQLMYIGSKYPIASLIRTRKFLKRGWTINAGQYLKMAFQVSMLDLTDISVLEDQLVGVDVGYFILLLEALRSAQDSHSGDIEKFVISYDYLSEIIDRIF